MRDVTASVLAAGIAAVGFSRLAHEPSIPAAQPPHGKSIERLSWEVEDIPTRITRHFDSVAMFAMPRVEPVAWSEAPVRMAEHPVLPTRTAQVEREPRRASVLPPTKPPVMVSTATQSPVLIEASAKAEERGLEVLGWHVPGTDLLPAIVPAGREALQRVTALGTSVGRTVVETVGLK